MVFTVLFSTQQGRYLLKRHDPTGLYSGFTDNYIKVSFKSGKNIENQLVDVYLENINEENEMVGKII